MSLEQRISELERLVAGQLELNKSTMAGSIIKDAQIMALYSFIAELAAQQGVTSDAFQKHHQLRFQWWQDHFLSATEEASPAIASELDERTGRASAVTEAYPSMFDPPHEHQP